MERILVTSELAPIPASAFSQGLRFGNLICTSGYLGTVPETNMLVEGGLDAELRQALENVRAVLEAGGSGMHYVVRTLVCLTDIQRFPDMDRVYREYFAPPWPTRNTLGVSALWLGACVSIDVWAIVPEH